MTETAASTLRRELDPHSRSWFRASTVQNRMTLRACRRGPWREVRGGRAVLRGSDSRAAGVPGRCDRGTEPALVEQTTQASQELHAASGALLRAMASFRLDADQGTPAAAAGEPQPRRSPLVLARPEDSGIAAA